MDSLPRLSDQYSAQGKSYSAKDYFAFDTGSIYLRCDMPLIFQIYFQYYVVAVLTDNFVINRNNGIGSFFFQTIPISFYSLLPDSFTIYQILR